LGSIFNEGLQMKVDGKDLRPIFFDEEKKEVCVIDQRILPHKLVIEELKTVDDVIKAIKDMYVRGAPLIGATGAYGIYVAAKNHKDGDFESYFLKECERIRFSRPTAVNLEWAVDRVLAKVREAGFKDVVELTLALAKEITEEEAENCRKIGEYGVSLIEEISKRKSGATVNILTHCNAGWLACVEHGTATAPMYAAFDKGIDIHVWVDETRPLNQGARLTAWELGKHGIKHTVITDNAGGHIMQHGMVDIVITGTDRTTYTGDVANKIGTYLKALAAKDNGIPFYVALPSSTFDWKLRDGVKEIPIEDRDENEIKYVTGLSEGKLHDVLITPENSNAANFAFDVTPARLVTGFITERGLCPASEEGVRELFPDK
jgi:methylthioribose-1-phosphate isomerase